MTLKCQYLAFWLDMIVLTVIFFPAIFIYPRLLAFKPQELKFIHFLIKYNFNKTGVINDPLGQPTVLAGSDCRWILKFCAGRTYIQMDGQTDVRTDGQHV